MNDMTLGARIAALRGENKLSQGDLAERLDVSRQAVSKWETDGSVPEVDKLIKMSEIFGVSLDTLIKGVEPVRSEPVVQPAPSVSFAPSAPAVRSGREIVGYILFGVGLFVCVLSLALGLLLLFIGVPLLIVGGVMAKGTRKAVLITLWVMVTLVLVFMNRVTSVDLIGVFNPTYYQVASPITIIVTWAIWGIIAALAIYTAKEMHFERTWWMVFVWVYGLLQVVSLVRCGMFLVQVCTGDISILNPELTIVITIKSMVIVVVQLLVVVALTLWWRRKQKQNNFEKSE